MQSIDYLAFRLLNGASVSLPWLVESVRVINLAGLPLICVLYAVCLIADQSTWRRLLSMGVASASLALMMNVLLGHFFYRPRPFVAHRVHLLIHHVADSSFPSDHAAVAFALAGALWVVNRRAGVVAFFVAAILSVARVVAGVHYPIDVIGGAVVGTIAAQLVVAIWGRVAPRP